MPRKRLRSNVELHIPAGAAILGSQDPADYPCETRNAGELLHRSRSLIVAEDASNIAITGHGLIDGRGTPEAFPAVRPGDELERPMLMRFLNCSHVLLRDVRLRNSASCGCHFIHCDQVCVEGVCIESRLNRNNDGLDLDGCRDVFISNCRLSTGDDALCPKSAVRATENVVVTNCVVSSNTAAFKIGTSSAGGFRDITLSNCVFRDCRMGASVSRFIRRMNEYTERYFSLSHDRHEQFKFWKKVMQSTQSFNAHALNGNTYKIRKLLYDRFPIINQYGITGM